MCNLSYNSNRYSVSNIVESTVVPVPSNLSLNRRQTVAANARRLTTDSVLNLMSTRSVTSSELVSSDGYSSGRAMWKNMF